MGTLGAVLIVYFKDIREILKSLVYYAGTRDASGHEKNLALAAAILIGSVPTAIIGLVMKQYEDILFTSSILVGSMLIVTGGLLWISRNYYRVGEGKHLSILRALIIGIVQGLAVIPGISRSGATIAAGLFTGLDRKTAARFSFLLCIPAILGAQVLTIKM